MRSAWFLKQYLEKFNLTFCYCCCSLSSFSFLFSFQMIWFSWISPNAMQCDSMRTLLHMLLFGWIRSFGFDYFYSVSVVCVWFWLSLLWIWLNTVHCIWIETKLLTLHQMKNALHKRECHIHALEHAHACRQTFLKEGKMHRIKEICCSCNTFPLHLIQSREKRLCSKLSLGADWMIWRKRARFTTWNNLLKYTFGS